MGGEATSTGGGEWGFCISPPTGPGHDVLAGEGDDPKELTDVVEDKEVVSANAVEDEDWHKEQVALSIGE